MVGFLVSAGPGLVARAAEPERWRERLMVDLASGEAPRVAQLARGHEGLEPAGPGSASGHAGSASAPSTAAERDALLAQNEELLRQNRALLLENRALADARARAAATCTPPDGEDPKAQLLYWGERLRHGGNGLRGGLNSTQAAALGVLLRPARPLDRDNPWE